MDPNQTSEPRENDLLSSIWWWRALIGLFGVFVVISYMLQFGVEPADAQEKWGQFGDYLGGLLNPVVAFAAFYWLTQSVKLQKQELAETREELRIAAQAQQETVRTAQVSVQLSALAALSNAAYAEISRIRDIMETITRNRPPDTERGIQRIYDQEHEHTLAQLNAQMKEAFAKRAVCTEQMENILR